MHLIPTQNGPESLKVVIPVEWEFRASKRDHNLSTFPPEFLHLAERTINQLSTDGILLKLTGSYVMLE